VASCEACRLEWELILRAKDLGAETGLSLDETAMTDTVLRRVRAAEAAGARRRVWMLGGLAVAASLAVILGGRMVSVPGSAATPPESLAVAVPTRLPSESLPASVETARLEVWVSELRDLSAEEMEMIMDSLDEPFRADELLESPTWVDGDGRGFAPGFSS
jgi:anti-sigma factor RsiW